MLTILNRYQFTIAASLPGLAALVVGLVLGARAIQLQVWTLLFIGGGLAFFGVCVLLIAWETYDREKKRR